MMQVCICPKGKYNIATWVSLYVHSYSFNYKVICIGFVYVKEKERERQRGRKRESENLNLISTVPGVNIPYLLCFGLSPLCIK